MQSDLYLGDKQVEIRSHQAGVQKPRSSPAFSGVLHVHTQRLVKGECLAMQSGCCFNRYMPGGGVRLKGQRKETNSHYKTPSQSPTENRDNTEAQSELEGTGSRRLARTGLQLLMISDVNITSSAACIIDWVCDGGAALPAPSQLLTASAQLKKCCQGIGFWCHAIFPVWESIELTSPCWYNRRGHHLNSTSIRPQRVDCDPTDLINIQKLNKKRL